jgi:hypothetical protein
MPMVRKANEMKDALIPDPPYCMSPHPNNHEGYPAWVDEPGYEGVHIYCALPANHDGDHQSESHKESDGGGTGHYDSWIVPGITWPQNEDE